MVTKSSKTDEGSRKGYMCSYSNDMGMIEMEFIFGLEGRRRKKEDDDDVDVDDDDDDDDDGGHDDHEERERERKKA